MEIGMRSAILLLTALIYTTGMLAQDSKRNDPCHAKPDSAQNFFSFDQFDKELRSALTKQDPVAMSFLVTFPLRVNDAGGTISLDDAAALKTHFQEVFTPAVRKEILGDKTEKTGCNEEGLDYARGVIWVNASRRGYAIEVVNRDAVPPYKFGRDAPTINYVCQTQTHRVVVDTTADGVLRYRSWNKPRPVIEIPDLVISKGKDAFEGTQLCAIPIYTFKNGDTEYQVEGGTGCDPGVPNDATGRLSVTVGDKDATTSFCY
jgi:hypothetical protein